MPSSPKKPPAKRRRRRDDEEDLRCAYREGKLRCPRDGEGNPPICAAHRIVLEASAARARPRDEVFSLLGDVIAGRSVSRDRVRSVGASLLGSFVVELEGGVQARMSDRPGPYPFGAGAAPRPPPRPPVDPARQAHLRQLADARQVLGFGMRDALDKPTVEKRRRDLARRHHPDRGGTVEAMTRVNAAADLLLGQIAKAA